MQLANRVRAVRKSLGLTQAELSRLSGVGRSTIAEIEEGRSVPGIDVVLRLAHALRVPVEALFFLK